MTRRVIAALALVGTVAACGTVRDSPINPLNWFGRSERVATDTSNPAADPRPLVTQIADLRLEQVPGGAIVKATGLPPRQGYYDAALLPMNSGLPVDGVMHYQLRAFPPQEPTRAGTPQSRELVVGLFVSDQTLAGIRTIRVSAAQNALAVRRR
ncbi:hypothetical protein P1J78_16675 [Psychromarinibacter sp. C21-152]|uniref:Lipoprotein n=1 Tax=Psychromarinibacter sediminicola TaxID=3033385 RepID=A0AAE3T9A9_9RHOB|nr:hypothetical protein [Psychromarinibacter sediminicola]MDF0602375.1 hypothetical protein [Psychromarinibacter sediminicola]